MRFALFLCIWIRWQSEITGASKNGVFRRYFRAVKFAWTLSPLLIRAQIKGPLVADAHLAALALEHGATLCSSDGDFARFPLLRWSNPLAS